jgi:stage II sporulation protein M
MKINNSGEQPVHVTVSTPISNQPAHDTTLEPGESYNGVCHIQDSHIIVDIRNGTERDIQSRQVGGDPREGRQDSGSAMTIGAKHLIAAYAAVMSVATIISYIGVGHGSSASITVAALAVMASPSYSLVHVATAGQPILHFLALFLNNLLLMALVAMGLTFIWEWRGTLWVMWISLAGNALTLGMFNGIAIAYYGIVAVTGGLLTHGVLEMSAFFIAYWACLGGVQRIREAKGANRDAVLKENWRLVKRYVIPLLFIAALLEAFVTPIVVRALV